LGLLVFGCLCNAVSFVALFFVPESPEYLYSFYRFRECREVITQMSKWNRSSLEQLE
jgi:hypothetical protein